MTEPQGLNVICPQCRLTWLVPLDARTYYCYACQYVVPERFLQEKGNAIHQG